MSSYIKERSFIATLRSVHPSYYASLDFSRQIEETEVVPAKHSISETLTTIRTEEYAYLTATTQPREVPHFYFLYRRWNNGSESYELKASHACFSGNKSRLGNVRVEALRVATDPFNIRNVDLYLRPSTSLSDNPGWKIELNGLPVTSADLKLGDVGPAKVIAPTGNPLGVYSRKNFGNHWWAYISCAKAYEPWLSAQTVPVPIMMHIHQIGMEDPLI